MKKLLVFTIFTLLILLPHTTLATPEFGKKESRNCDYCHISGDYTKLNSRGEYYLKHNFSFEGYKEKIEKGEGIGEKLYMRYCQGCHGEVNDYFKNKEINEEVISVIKSGKMPPNIKLDLNDTEIKALAKYVGYWCNLCHGKMLPNPEEREIHAEGHPSSLKHGEFWCLNCHNLNDRDYLKLINGKLIPFNQSPELCGECHGQVYNEWKEEIHGRWVGSINNPIADVICVDCHNPHSPKFSPIEPMPTPQEKLLSFEPANYRNIAIAVVAISVLLMAYAGSGRR